MDRKDFLKISCNTCLLGAAAMLLPGMTGCSPAAYTVFKTAVVENKITIPLILFAKNKLQLVRPKEWQYDIAVQKKEDGTYSALLLQCTHMNNQLVSEQNGFYCSLHGSRFTNDGAVVKGPAEISLKKFKTIISNTDLIILT